MKIATFIEENTIKYGVVHGEEITAVRPSFLEKHPSVKDVLTADALDELKNEVQTSRIKIPLTSVQLLPPVHNPSRIFCVGINYPKRYPINNTPMPPPENIILFAKLDGTLVGHNTPLEMPKGEAAKTFDYEGEIVVVIGKNGRFIPESDTMNYVAGYTIMNDGSVRGWQKHSVHAGKNFANSGSCGPWLVTADKINDPFEMTLKTRLNGEEVQNTIAKNMVFQIPALIAYLSHTIDLRPGDLIATGSPEGSGGSRQPQRFLQVGDELEIEVSGVGILKNKVQES
ncbi:MAG: fumarylacetoacetate hydrolase family protein [Chloroflexota bacterium]